MASAEPVMKADADPRGICLGTHGGPEARSCSPFTTQTTTTARLCWLCPSHASGLLGVLGTGTFPRAASATGDISPPAPMMLMGQPLHSQLGSAQDLCRASGRAGLSHLYAPSLQ